MSDPAIGQTDKPKVNVHVIGVPNGARLVFVTNDGKYLGTLEYDAASPDVVGVIGNLFQQFAAQQSGGIQIANGVPGLRVS